MRDIDRMTTEQYGVPSLLLMETAARCALQEIAACFSHNLKGKRALLFCGGGNNGGDGAALARGLWTAGARTVNVLLFSQLAGTRGDARTNFEIVRRLAESLNANPHEESSPLSFVECDTLQKWEEMVALPFAPFDIIVDALFGTGLTRPLETLYHRAVEYINRVRETREEANADRPLIVSLDLPSGLNADSGEIIGETVRADLTVTFTAPKAANILAPAAHYNGRLVVAHIGSPPALIAENESQLFVTERRDVRAWLKATRYTPDSYKNTHGHILVVAGSRELSGAAVLSSDAAMRAGAGLVTLATPQSAYRAVSARVMSEVMVAGLPETAHGAASAEAVERVMELAERATVIAIGPGLSSSDEETRRFVRAVVERRSTPIVIDADGLNALAPWPADLRGSRERPLILTPHLGEMRRLIGAPDSQEVLDRVRVAREFATTNGVILVLKGARAIIASPDGRVFVNPTGNAGLGTAGSGDTLTGIIAAFNAQAFAALRDKADALVATISAVYVGGVAGDIAAREKGMRTMLASDVRESLGAAIRLIDARGEQP